MGSVSAADEAAGALSAGPSDSRQHHHVDDVTGATSPEIRQRRSRCSGRASGAGAGVAQARRRGRTASSPPGLERLTDSTSHTRAWASCVAEQVSRKASAEGRP